MVKNKQVFYVGNGPEYEILEDYLEIIETNKNRIKFHLQKHGTNGATCELYAFAKRSKESPNEYVFIDNKEHWFPHYEGQEYEALDRECGLTLNFKDNEVVLNQIGWCIGFCGARADLSGKLTKMKTPKIPCADWENP